MDTYFYRAVRKYGFECFKYKVLEEVEAKTKVELWDKLTRKEVEYIAKHKTNHPKYGYNTTIGGDGVIGYKMTREDRKKLSQSLKGKLAGKKNPRYGKPGTFLGKKHTKETREHLSKIHTGKKLTEAHKRKIGESSLGRTHSKESRKKMRKVQTKLRGQPVYCIELDRHFESVSAAARYIGSSSSEISAVCKGKRHSVKGYTFNYVKDGQVVEVQRENKARQPIKCIETGEVFESITQCAKEMGLKHQHISACLHGRQKTTGGYSFKTLS